MIKKVSLFIVLILLPVLAFAQYHGGSYDGYAKGETTVPHKRACRSSRFVVRNTVFFSDGNVAILICSYGLPSQSSLHYALVNLEQ